MGLMRELVVVFVLFLLEFALMEAFMNGNAKNKAGF